MAQTTTLKIQLFSSGYCVAHEKIVNPINGKGKCKFYAVWALIYVPNIGNMLFDTGYSEAFYESTKKFPERFYRWATPVYLNKNETARHILTERDISPDEIKYIILSHFHADHIAGLKDFPNSKIICSKSSHLEVLNTKGLKAVSKGILHQLLPYGYEKRLLYIEDIADQITVNKYGITEYSIFGIQDFKLVLLPGHAKGMLGFIVQDDEKHFLYASDASWSYDSYQQGILPNKIVKLFFDSWNDFIETQVKLMAYEKDNDGVNVLFTHCPKTLNHTNDAI
jgi:glyoxylase-like metal-dependent hydrolase (beta-lactamase superfamily II)